MGLNLKNAKIGGGAMPTDSGTYNGVCVGIANIGLQRTNWNGQFKETHQICIGWEFEYLDANGEVKRRVIWRVYTFSMHEKSNLRLDLRNWRGRDFTAIELADFPLTNMIGEPCCLTIAQRVSASGNTYSYVASVGKAMSGQAAIQPSKRLVFDVDDRSTWGAFTELPEWIQNLINASVTLQNQGIFLDDTGTPVSISPQSAVPNTQLPAPMGMPTALPPTPPQTPQQLPYNPIANAFFTGSAATGGTADTIF